jgi:hypothetical protein
MGEAGAATPAIEMTARDESRQRCGRRDGRGARCCVEASAAAVTDAAWSADMDDNRESPRASTRLLLLVHSSYAKDRVTHACFDAIAVARADLGHVRGQGIASPMKAAAEAAQPAGPGIAPSASLIRVQTFMLTMTATISSISSGLKCWASASWKR